MVIKESRRFQQVISSIDLELEDTSASPWTEKDRKQRSSAVLLLLLNPGSHTPPEILFTQRSLVVKTHKAQIGFPGGRCEDSDESPADTALREGYEEIGLPPESVTIHGALPPVPSLDRSPVVTVVGTSLYARELLQANEEVAQIFSLPWHHFRVGKEEKRRFTLFGQTRQTFVFNIEGYRIWGLTAHLIVQAQLKAALPDSP